jgi:signal transduction histidine kinase
MLPEGRSLPDEMWAPRHRGILILLYAHAAAIVIFGLIRGYTLTHSLLEASIVAGLASVAALPGGSRRLRSAMGAFALISASAILVHMSGGAIEMHFHFFVALGILTLYQDWMTFLLALGYVVVHHALMGYIDPSSVYNHGAAQQSPWKWALIHGFFVTAACVVLIISWRVNETERAKAEEYRRVLDGMEIRRTQALEINDNIVQGLTVAQMALAMDRTEESAEALSETLKKARSIISDLLGEANTELHAGDLVREKPSIVRAV